MAGILLEVMDRIAGGEISSMREAIDAYGSRLSESVNNEELLKERIAELELALDDQGWTRLSGSGDKEFSRSALKTINKLARMYWLKNPLIKRAVYTQTAYVFGQGVTIKAKDQDVQEVLDRFLEDDKNKTELMSHQARMLKETELQLFSNLFFVMFTNISTGHVRVRTIDPDEIEDIVYNPADRKEPWYYLRVWTEPAEVGSERTVERKAYYPDYRYNPKGGHPARLNGAQVMLEQVYHVKVNALSDMRFGVSEIYAAIDWAKAYKEFLEDWATLVKSLSRFAWKGKSKTGRKGIEAITEKLNSTISSTDPNETNAPPAAGSVWLEGANVDLTPITKSGTTTSVEDGRRMLLMVSAATGIFEHYFGDPSTGNLATTTAMERPMELMFRDRQELWSDVFQTICGYAVDMAVAMPSGGLSGTLTYNEYNERVIEPAENYDTTIEVTWPDLLEKDVAARVEAIIKAVTLGSQGPAGTIDLPLATKMLLVALGEPDVDGTVERLFGDRADGNWEDEEARQAEKVLKQQQAMVAAGMNPVPLKNGDSTGDGDGPPKPPEATGDTQGAQEALTVSDAFVRSVERLTEALEEVLEHEGD